MEIKALNTLLPYFEGGQVEVQNLTEGYLYRGEIQSIQLLSDPKHPNDLSHADLDLKLAWNAKFVGGDWINEDRLEVKFSLMSYSLSYIDEGRLSLHGWVNGEEVVLFPKGGSRLDPARVIGLSMKPDEPTPPLLKD